MVKRHRKQVGFTLSAEARVLLKKLAILYHMKQAQVVENMIRERALERAVIASAEEIAEMADEGE